MKMDNLSIISFSILIKLICSSSASGEYQGDNSRAVLTQADGKFMNAFREKFYSEKKIDRILDKMLKLIQKQFIRLRTKKSFSSLRIRNDGMLVGITYIDTQNRNIMLTNISISICKWQMRTIYLLYGQGEGWSVGPDGVKSFQNFHLDIMISELHDGLMNI